MNVFLYARVSTVRQAEADISIPDQVNRMREWCRNNDHTVIHEHIEPGASATDDKRPVLQAMIDAATKKPFPVQAIIVHSRSRFFRDMYGAVHYERMLKKAGVTVISITQPTSDDSTGEMMRNMITLMDEYNSKENAKHVSRAMLENARRGNFNGARPPYGYKAVETEVTGHKGKKRRKLEIDDREALVVKQIYRLYLHGHNGHTMGIKSIVEHLNTQGITMRGKPWISRTVGLVLSETTYKGEYLFNVREARTGKTRPEQDWVRTQIPAIIDETMYEAARRIRESRDPSKVGNAGHADTSPTLLTGLIRCDYCDAAMTLATGKAGRYRYYKCNHKIKVSTTACDTPNLPMDKMDQLILNRLVDKVLTPERVTAILKEWLTHRGKQASAANTETKRLEKALKAADDGLNNLYEAIEKGVVTLDSTFQARVNHLKDERARILGEMTQVKQALPSPRRLSPKQVEFACAKMCAMLLDPEAGYGKHSLKALGTEIRVKPGLAEVTGSAAALENAVSEMKPGTPLGVPSLVSKWWAVSGSNTRPTD